MELMVPLSEQKQDEIYAEVDYKIDQLNQDVKQIREWLEQQHHLPPSRLTENDNFIKTYLVACKGSLEKVKRKLDSYYTYRSNSPLFENRDPLDEEYAIKSKVIYTCLLPQYSNSNEQIVFYQVHDPDIKNFSFVHCMRYIAQKIELVMRMSNIVGKISYILDLKGLTINHISKLPLIVARDSLDFAQNVLPHRLQNVIIINLLPVLEVTMNNLIKPFLSKKLKKRVFMFSGGYEELFRFYDKRILPKDFGGEESKTLQELSECWDKKEISERSWFINELSEHTDESKRVTIEGTILQDSYFGVHGSLKKLVID